MDDAAKIRLSGYIGGMPGYSSGTPAADILAYLGATTVTIERAVSPEVWMRWASVTNVPIKMETELLAHAAGTSVRSPQVLSDFYWLSYILRSAGGSFEVSKAEARAAIQRLIGNGLSSGDGTALLNLINDTVTMREDTMSSLDDASALAWIGQVRP